MHSCTKKLHKGLTMPERLTIPSFDWRGKILVSQARPFTVKRACSRLPLPKPPSSVLRVLFSVHPVHVARCILLVASIYHAACRQRHAARRQRHAACCPSYPSPCSVHRASRAPRVAGAAWCTRAVNRRHHAEGCRWIAGRWNGCARHGLPCKRRRAGAPARSLGRAADAPHGRRRHNRGEDGAATRLANAEAFSNQRGIAAAAAEAFRAAVSRSLTTHGYPQWHDIPCDTVSHGGTVQGVVHPLPCGMPQRHGISQRHGIP